MKRLAFIVGAALILIIGGGLTAQLRTQSAETLIPGVIRQVDSPDGSPLALEGWKAEQLFMLIGFILFNLVGAGVTLTIVMWFLNREVKSVKAGDSPTRRAPVQSQEDAAESS